MKRLFFLVMAILLFSTGIAVYASDVTDADYYGIILISNSGTTATGVSTNISGLNTPTLISADFINSSANNCAIINSAGGDAVFMPGYSSNPWIVFVDSIGANNTATNTLYCKNVTGGDIAYFPGNDGMAVSDDATLEIGDNFTIEYSGYVNTNYVEYVIGKEYSFTIQTDNVSGNITAGFPDEVNPTGFSDPSSQWTSETNTYDDDTGTFTFDSIGAPGWSANLSLTHTAINVCGIRIWLSDTNDNPADAVDIALYYDGDSHVIHNGDYTRDAWNYFSAGGLKVGVTAINLRMYGATAGGEQLRVYEVDYYSTVSPYVTSTQSPGEYHIKVSANTTDLMMYIDDMVTPISTSALGGASALDNTEDWQIGDDHSTPYIETANITVNGTLRGSWRWEYATTFTDLSGNGNDATPVFRTTSSDADVSAVLSVFYPTSEPEAPEFSVGTGPDFISSNITISGNFTTGNASLSFPGSDVLLSITSATGVPYQIPSTFIATFLILIFSMGTSYFLKKYATPSMFVKTVVNAIGYGVAVTLQVYDWWMLIFFFIFEIGFWFAAAERKA